ncbi:MAG: patatin-like phospholipase family protein [Isosphaeraceae bacterium]
MDTAKRGRATKPAGNGGPPARSRVAIACQGGGSHTVFTAGVLRGLLERLPNDVEIVAISGTSGGAICAALAWDGLVHGDFERAGRKLLDFWVEVSAREPWDACLNAGMLAMARLGDFMTMPAVSPYALPNWGADRFRAMLARYFDFDELRELARRPGAPAIYIGAVEVLTGHFEAFTGPELTVDCLLASAAIPELFRAVEIPGYGSYWDGLFSQNPPVHDLSDHNINELWVIQINPSACARVPMQIHEINDRRNGLAGNISLEQELNQIAMINRLIARGVLSDPKYHPIDVARLAFDRELSYETKLDRRPEFLEELRTYGHTKARIFLEERESRKHTLQALGVLAAD